MIKARAFSAERAVWRLTSYLVASSSPHLRPGNADNPVFARTDQFSATRSGLLRRGRRPGSKIAAKTNMTVSAEAPDSGHIAIHSHVSRQGYPQDQK